MHMFIYLFFDYITPRTAHTKPINLNLCTQTRTKSPAERSFSGGNNKFKQFRKAYRKCSHIAPIMHDNEHVIGIHLLSAGSSKVQQWVDSYKLIVAEEHLISFLL